VPLPTGKILSLSLTTGFLLLGLWTPLKDARAHTGSAPAFQYVEPFLYPPYPGTATENAIFDHSSPDYSQTDNRLITFTGDQATKVCPNTTSFGKAPPQSGVCDLGSGIYWSYSLGDWLFYNGHDGIDYGLQYSPLYASADTDQVVYAGWQDPMDHTYSMGLYVRLLHTNGYSTTYGHMSTVAVQSCSFVGCANFPHGELIGYSGNTGNSTGPHLHFRVANPSNKSIDPYGWTGEYADPWPYNQRNSLWAQYPSVMPYYGSTASVLPTDGIPLAYPAEVTDASEVDDSSPGFSESPAGCWTVTTTADSLSENGSMRFASPVISTSATCTARWNFPGIKSAGAYLVYIHIPSIHATSESALYTVYHNGRLDNVTVNQSVFPNPFHVTDGWLYIGKYDFSSSGEEYISLSNLTQDTLSSFQARQVAVDAVRFLELNGIAPTNTPRPSATLSFTPRPTGTGTSTPTRRPTSTPSPTRTSTFTPTHTPNPTNSSTILQPFPLRKPHFLPKRFPTDTHWPMLW
jgi:hypothetical protein